MSEKKCPYCKLKIDENALKCNHCHSDLSEKSCEKDGGLFVSSDNMFFFKVIATIFVFIGLFYGLHVSNILEKIKKIEEAGEKVDVINKMHSQTEEVEKTIKRIISAGDVNKNIIDINNILGDHLYNLAKEKSIKKLKYENLKIERYYSLEYENLEIIIRLKEKNLEITNNDRALIYFNKGEGFTYRLVELKSIKNFTYKFGVENDFEYSIIVLKEGGGFLYGDFEFELSSDEKRQINNKKDK